MLKNIVINGQFFIQKPTGQQRFAKEILLELDKIINKDEITIIVPKGTIDMPTYKNFQILSVGCMKNRLWEQLVLGSYLLKNQKVSFNFCNTSPFLKKGPTVIHDLAVITHKEYFNTWKGRLASLYYTINQKQVINSDQPILTVSEFSKNDILKVFKLPQNRITVIPNAWQHFNRVAADEDVFFKYSIKKGDYFFSLGSWAKHKNFEWIHNNAKYNPKETYIVAGMKTKSYKHQDVNIPSNVYHLGFLSDGEVKALMSHCKAFIFPSLFEGFGIPPLEALSVSAPIIVSNVTCLPEIFEDAASYIDPKNPKVDIVEKLKPNDEAKRIEILSKYSWEKSAKLLYEFLKEYDQTYKH